jgi:hypothetical protein
MAISNRDISVGLAGYLERYPDEAALLSEPMRLLSQGGDFAARRNFPMHVTVGALLVRGAEILLIGHRAYGIVLQPGGHLEPADSTLSGAAQARCPASRRPRYTSSTAGSRHGRTRASRPISTSTSGTPSRHPTVTLAASRSPRSRVPAGTRSP